MRTPESLASWKPRLVLDFDGVLHSYTSGWTGVGNIPDPPVPGAQEFCRAAMEQFNVLIISTRCAQEEGWLAMREWLKTWGFPIELDVSTTAIKEPATLTIDDRAIQFKGEWPSIESLINFRPWNRASQG